MLIKQIRTCLNVSQTEFAEQLTVTFTTVIVGKMGVLYRTNWRSPKYMTYVRKITINNDGGAIWHLKIN